MSQKIDRKGTLAVADAVLACIELRLNEDDNTQLFTLECYANGREHGYAITSFLDFKVVFSECRNSDNIIVFSGKRNDFDDAGNIPNEKVYKKVKRFDYDEIFDAAEYIVKLMREYVMAESLISGKK